MLFSVQFLTACGDVGFSTKTEGKPEVQYKAEPTYDETPRTILPKAGFNTITVSGTASFTRRIFDAGIGPKGALSHNFATIGIPCSEFNIYDSSSNLVQAGATNEDGTFSFQLSSEPATYTMVVRSRGFNNCLKTSILSDINSNLPYGVTKSLSVSGSNVSGFNLVASGNESDSSLIVGGAFNILYQIFRANDFLRTKAVFGASATADKVTVYWQAGFTPYAYYGYPSSPISFYEPGKSKLYICGGVQGNVDSADTDHFDDSVILHEYAHFLEDRYSRSESPGGSHNGNFIIDARLAWSEGWANYFQSAVRTHFGDVEDEFYIDTIGHKTSVADANGFRVGIKFKLNANVTNGETDEVKDIPQFTSEGNFREMAIARTLYKSTVTSYDPGTNGGTGGNVDFAHIWSAFTTLKTSTQLLTNFARFAANLKSILETNSAWASRSTAISSIYSEEKQPADTREYGAPLSTSGSTCPIAMTATVDSAFPGTGEVRSNQLRSNDFFLISYDGSSPLVLELLKTQDKSNERDVDLFIYKSDYVYQEPSSTAKNSTLVRTSATRSPAAAETVNFAGLPAGTYVVNVKAYMDTFKSGALEYQLRTTQAGGGYQCPVTAVTQ